MKIRALMTSPVIRVCEDEPVSVAARNMERYQIGALPVCNSEGKLCGVLTDRDIVIRCLAAGRPAEKTLVGQVMTAGVLSVEPEMDAASAAKLMGVKQVRRLPVVEDEKLCGMVSLGDLANAWEGTGADEALALISRPFR